MTPETPPPVPSVGDAVTTGTRGGHFHRHSVLIGTEVVASPGVYPDGHDGPCDNPYAVYVLDPRQMDTVRTFQRAYDNHGVGLRAMVQAVVALTAGAVA